MRIHMDLCGLSEYDRQYEALVRELEAYQKNRVKLLLDGQQSSPYQIANACMVLEEGCYMRDYVEDENGKVTELWFQRVKEDS